MYRVSAGEAYTRLADRLYLFENLDGNGFRAELPVDEDGIVRTIRNCSGG